MHNNPRMPGKPSPRNVFISVSPRTEKRGKKPQAGKKKPVVAAAVVTTTVPAVAKKANDQKGTPNDGAVPRWALVVGLLLAVGAAVCLALYLKFLKKTTAVPSTIAATGAATTPTTPGDEGGATGGSDDTGGTIGGTGDGSAPGTTIAAAQAGIPPWGIAGIVLLGVLVLCAGLYGLFRRWRRIRSSTVLGDDENTPLLAPSALPAGTTVLDNSGGGNTPLLAPPSETSSLVPSAGLDDQSSATPPPTKKGFRSLLARDDDGEEEAPALEVKSRNDDHFLKLELAMSHVFDAARMQGDGSLQLKQDAAKGLKTHMKTFHDLKKEFSDAEVMQLATDMIKVRFKHTAAFANFEGKNASKKIDDFLKSAKEKSSKETAKQQEEIVK